MKINFEPIKYELVIDPESDRSQIKSLDSPLEFNKSLARGALAIADLGVGLVGAPLAGLGALGTAAVTRDAKKAIEVGGEVMHTTMPSTIIENIGKLTGSKWLQDVISNYRDSPEYFNLVERVGGALGMAARDIGAEVTKKLTGSKDYELANIGSDIGELALVSAAAASLPRFRGAPARFRERAREMARENQVRTEPSPTMADLVEFEPVTPEIGDLVSPKERPVQAPERPVIDVPEEPLYSPVDLSAYDTLNLKPKDLGLPEDPRIPKPAESVQDITSFMERYIEKLTDIERKLPETESEYKKYRQEVLQKYDIELPKNLEGVREKLNESIKIAQEDVANSYKEFRQSMEGVGDMYKRADVLREELAKLPEQISEETPAGRYIEKLRAERTEQLLDIEKQIHKALTEEVRIPIEDWSLWNSQYNTLLRQREQLAKTLQKLPKVRESDISKTPLLRERALTRERLLDTAEKLDAKIAETRRNAIESVRSHLENAIKRRQAGQVNPEIFTGAFNAAKVVLDRFDLRFINLFTLAQRRNIPERVISYAEQNKLLPVNAINNVAIVAKDKATGKPAGILQMSLVRDRKTGEQFLEADWVWVEREFRERGLAREMYKFMIELGNDIRASASRTPDGRRMWEAFEKTLPHREVRSGSRPILAGTRRSQEGAIIFNRDPEFKEFKKNLPAAMRPWAKELYKEYQKERQRIQVTENSATNVLKNLPEISREIDIYENVTKPIDELIPEFQKVKDIPGRKDLKGSPLKNLAAEIATWTLPGSQGVGKFYNNPIIKWIATKTRWASNEAQRQISAYLYDRPNGIIPKYSALSSEERVLLRDIILEGEGKKVFTAAELRERGVPASVIEVYQLIRQADDFILDYGNAVRISLGHKPITRRVGHFPYKFVGKYYFTITRFNPNTKNYELVAFHTENSASTIRKVHQEISNKLAQAGSPDSRLPALKPGEKYIISDIFDRSGMYNPAGFTSAYTAYSQLWSVVEAGSQHAKILGEILHELSTTKAYDTRGFRMHEKFKKGVLGSEGRKLGERDPVKEANDMMRSFRDYVHQAFEWGELAKLGSDVAKILDKNLFPNIPNIQDYVAWYYDNVRGIPTTFAKMASNAVDFMSRVTGIPLRTVGKAVHSYIAWNLLSGYNFKFLIMQLVQPAQFIAQNLADLVAKGAQIKNGAIMEGFLSSLVDITPFIYHESKYGRGAAAPKYADLQWASRHRVFDQSLLEEVSDFFTLKDVNAMTLLTGNFWVMVAEQFARMQVFNMWNSVLKNLDGITIPRETRLKMAADFVHWTMTDYSPKEMPRLYASLGPIGTGAAALARFKHNYFGQIAVRIAEWARSGFASEKLYPIALTLIMMQFWSGLLGFPGRDILDWFANSIKESTDLEIMNATQFLLAMEDASAFMPYVTRGISPITGADLSSSLGMASVLPTENTIMPFYSKAFDIAKAGWKLAVNRTQETLYDFLTQLSSSGVIKAPLEWAFSEGEMVMGREGKGDVYKRTKEDWIYRWLTMYSIPEAKERMARLELERDKRIRAEAISSLFDKAWDDYRSGMPIRDITVKYESRLRKWAIPVSEFIQAIRQREIDARTTREERDLGLNIRTPNQIKRRLEYERYR